MLRFYTPADRRKSLLSLYRIQSITDYIESISKIYIDKDVFKNAYVPHADYQDIHHHLSRMIDKASRVVFLGVYDLQKEMYYINKYPNKKFIAGDVSNKALIKIEPYFSNVEVVQTTHIEFEDKPGDLIVINAAEYFLSRQELSEFVKKGENIIINMSHLYVPGWRWCIYAALQEFRAFVVNPISLILNIRQWQFRGWWRTVDDFIDAASGSNKELKHIIFNKTTRTKLGLLYRASICYEKFLDNAPR